MDIYGLPIQTLVWFDSIGDDGCQDVERVVADENHLEWGSMSNP